MAVTINRILSDGSQFATIEFVTSGDAAGEVGDIIDIGTLIGANGSGNERVRVKKIEASTASLNPSGGVFSLIWGGSEDLFCTIGVGTSKIDTAFEPTNGFDGTISYIASANLSATLRIRLEKLEGFANTTATFRNI